MTTRRRRKRKRSKRSSSPSYHQLLFLSFSIGFSYFVGNYTGTKLIVNDSSCEDQESNMKSNGNNVLDQNKMHKLEEEEDEIERIDRLVKERVQAALDAREMEGGERSFSRSKFPKSISAFANGAVRVFQEDFLAQFDYGTPQKHLSSTGNSEAIILYNTQDSVPTKYNPQAHQMELYTTKEALENCDAMNVIYQSPKLNSGQCFSIVGNYESYHVQKWMRMSNNNFASGSAHDLLPVGHATNERGQNDFKPPNKKNAKKHQQLLKRFLDTKDRIRKDLVVILERVAIQNTIIVMTTNLGQCELLINWFCRAKSKGFDISNVIVFATDVEAANISKSLGLETFYDEETFGPLSSKVAENYGDKAFSDMMYSKVLSVILVNSLGYDILFQDVDVVWYRHPLDFFHDKSSPLSDKDVIFQDDGSRVARFGPSSANSGFYFARYNDRTQYLFTALLYSSGMIFESGSHQQVLIALMNEHSSMYGLRINILGDEFPCGKHFHQNKAFMKELIQEKRSPYVFHMSWTKNKGNKIKFLKQMGLWNVNEECEGSQDLEQQGQSARPTQSCCSAVPIVSCHYKDKPSLIPCKDSPNIDEGGLSFW